MIKSFFTLLTIFFVLSCHPNKTKVAIEPKASGINLKNIDHSIRPQDDFYWFVNGQWLKTTQIPSDKSYYGTYSMLREKASHQVSQIIEEISQTNHSLGSAEQKVSDIYKTFMDVERLDALGIDSLKEEFHRIDMISNLTDLSEYIGYADVYSKAPFGFYVFNDDKNSSEYIIYFKQDGLGLPNRDYYLKTDDKSKEIQNHYVDHIGKMLSFAEIKYSREKAKAIFQLEKTLAENHWDSSRSNDEDQTYNKMSFAQLENLLPTVQWDAWLKHTMIERPLHVVVEQPSYYESLNSTLKNTSIEVWKDYFRWHLISYRASSLSSSFDKEDFAFFKGILKGANKQESRNKRGFTLVNWAAKDLLGKLYIKKHFSNQMKEHTLKIVNDITRTFKDSINNLEWMSDETKIKALEKLSKTQTKIAYPETWDDYSELNINDHDLFLNRKEITRFYVQKSRSRLGKPVDKDIWYEGPQTASAYSTPANNEIVITAGHLQSPFINMENDDAINYGSIGVIIAHELGHLFDNGGSKFDADGNRVDWWSSHDYKEFTKRTSQLIDQFNSYTVLDGIHLNGELTLSENIADLTGLTIAYNAFKTYYTGDQIIDGFTPEQRFFIGYAQIWMNKYRDQELRYQVNTNYHSPSEFRVNGILRNFPPFYKAFNVLQGDGMYLSSEQIVKIW